MPTTKRPVLILIDFVGATWARYLGKTRTMHGHFVDQTEAELRQMEWRDTLQTLRYRPHEIDASYKGDGPEAA